jgi:hypothetical protein
MKHFSIKIISIVGVLSVFLIGCHVYSCEPNLINPTFIGFSATDIDTVILRAYEPNDNYQHLVDTFRVFKNKAVYTTMHDTTIVYLNVVYDGIANQIIKAGFDWQIYIPAKKRTVSISNIMTDATVGQHHCFNDITSFVQDGQTITPHLFNTGEFYTSGFRAYITN